MYNVFRFVTCLYLMFFFHGDVKMVLLEFCDCFGHYKNAMPWMTSFSFSIFDIIIAVLNIIYLWNKEQFIEVNHEKNWKKKRLICISVRMGFRHYASWYLFFVPVQIDVLCWFPRYVPVGPCRFLAAESPHHQHWVAHLYAHVHFS